MPLVVGLYNAYHLIAVIDSHLSIRFGRARDSRRCVVSETVCRQSLTVGRDFGDGNGGCSSINIVYRLLRNAPATVAIAVRITITSKDIALVPIIVVQQQGEGRGT